LNFTPDIIFIDGDHSYEGVRRDIQMWLPHCSDTLFCCHDYTKAHKGVMKAIDELLPDVVPGNRGTAFYYVGRK